MLFVTLLYEMNLLIFVLFVGVCSFAHITRHLSAPVFFQGGKMGVVDEGGPVMGNLRKLISKNNSQMTKVLKISSELYQGLMSKYHK